MRKSIRILLEKVLDLAGYQIILHKKIKLRNIWQGSKFERNYLEKIVIKLNSWLEESPRNLLEIGANLGQDSAYLSHVWNIPPQNVYCLEPIKEFAESIKNKYHFCVFNLAAFNTTGEMLFNNGYTDETKMAAAGSSSLLNRTSGYNSKSEIVKTVRMDDWMNLNSIKEIDFLKIDAEGVSYEIIEGFGDLISKVKVIQIETERKEYWENQKIEKLVFSLLETLEFELVDYVLSDPPTHGDSLWIKKGILNSM